MKISWPERFLVVILQTRAYVMAGNTSHKSPPLLKYLAPFQCTFDPIPNHIWKLCNGCIKLVRFARDIQHIPKWMDGTTFLLWLRWNCEIDEPIHAIPRLRLGNCRNCKTIRNSSWRYGKTTWRWIKTIIRPETTFPRYWSKFENLMHQRRPRLVVIFAFES